MSKMTIKVNIKGAAEEETLGPSEKWMAKNINRKDVLTAVRTAFSAYLRGLGKELKQEYLTTAPDRDVMGNPNSDDVVASYVGRGHYERGRNLPFGKESGQRATIPEGAVPPNGVLSGKLAKSIGNPKIIVSGGAFKVICGPDLRNIPLDFYLHKTLTTFHSFPKLSMPQEYQRKGGVFESARADAMARLKRLEDRDK